MIVRHASQTLQSLLLELWVEEWVPGSRHRLVPTRTCPSGTNFSIYCTSTILQILAILIETLSVVGRYK